MDREKFLRNVALFSGLDQVNLKHVADICSEKKYNKNDVLIRQGDVGNSLFIITQGTVKIEKVTSQNERLNIALCGPGDFFGEMTVLDNSPRSASIIAIEDTECLILKSNDFLPLLEKHLRISFNLLPVVVKRFRETNQRLLHYNSSLIPKNTPNERPKPETFSIQSIRSLLVDITSLALRYWMQTTGKNKIELAQESEIWTASIDSYGTYSTRTLDRYLNIDKLPQNPRWNNVLRTAYFTIQNCPDRAGDLRDELEEKTNLLESLKSGIFN